MAVKKSASAKPILYGLGGLGLAALENQYIGSELPKPLKDVNLGIGGVTGVLAAHPNPEVMSAALLGIPFKEMALFGIGAVDKLRRQQQSLVNANLSVADINRQTAEIQRSNASGARGMQLAFLIPALLGGGAAGLWALDKWKKHKNPRYQTVGERGQGTSRPKIKIDIPASAVPPEFYKSLTTPDERDRAHVRLMQLMDPNLRRQQTYDEAMEGIPQEEQAKASAFVKKAMTDDNERISLPRMLLSTAGEMTGIPAAYRSAKDITHGFQNFTGDRWGEAARYGAAGLGNAAIALATMRWGAPAAARMLGMSRLLRHTGQAASLGTKGLGLMDRIMARTLPAAARPGFASLPGTKPLIQFPTAAKWLTRHTAWEGMPHSQFEAEQLARYAHNPNAFAWEGRNPALDKMIPDPVAQTQAALSAHYGLPGPAGPTDMALPYGGGGRSPITNFLYRNFLTAGKRTPTTPWGWGPYMARYGANRALQAGSNVRNLMGRYPNASLFFGGMPFAGMGTKRDEDLEEAARRNLRGYIPDWAKHRGYFGMPVTGTMSNVFRLLGAPDASSPVREQMQMMQPAYNPYALWQ